MPRKPKPSKQIVAFKVEPDLAALLDAMPNKSEFIRNAVARQLSTACPLCRGTGIAPFTGVSDELTRLVQQHPAPGLLLLFLWDKGQLANAWPA